jgi:hypothetical protein
MKQSNMKHHTITKWALFYIILLLTSCKKLVEVSAPITSTNGANVYSNDATAAAVLTGAYISMSGDGLTSGQYMNSFMSFYSELSADNLALYSGVNNITYSEYYTNGLSNTTAPNIWLTTYPEIFVINSAIEGLSGSTALTPSVKQQLLGEAEFLRAFNYFYLVNLYGNIPLVLTTDPKQNARISQSPVDTIYDQILSDLIDAQKNLASGYLLSDATTSTTERTRPNKGAATAMLARAYLYKGDWANAETQASSLINSMMYALDSLNDVFLANSSEAIWQLQPVNDGRNTEDGWVYIIPSTGPSVNNPVYLSQNLLSSFEPGDERMINWVNVFIDSTVAPAVSYYYPFKYKSAMYGSPVTEYQMILRLGEQYLIRAEARLEQANISGAVIDLNVIRTRAGLPLYSGNLDQASVLSAIVRERQVELFTEMGHRWLDLKRLGLVNSVMSVACPQKGGSWQSGWQYYPIAASELQLNASLTQNQGY